MNRPQSLTVKIKKCDKEIKLYVIELEKENLKLQERIAKFQVENITYQNEIKALKKFQPKPPNIVVNRIKYNEQDKTGHNTVK